MMASGIDAMRKTIREKEPMRPSTRRSAILQVDTYPLTIYSAAAVRELNGKVEEQRSELKQKEAEITELKRRLEKLERLMNEKNGGVK